jgi:hypothetical protein
MRKFINTWFLEVESNGIWKEIGGIEFEDLRIKKLGNEIIDLRFVVNNKIIDYLNDDIKRIRLYAIEIDEHETEIICKHSYILNSWTISGNMVLALSPHSTVGYIKEPVKN